MKKIFFLFAVLFCLHACSKTGEEHIAIRVENNTVQNFKEVLVNNKSYKNVQASSTTSYQFFESLLSIPDATGILGNNDTTYIGALYYDWLEYLPEGKYTLKIFDDTSTISNFNCAYIKD
jgi:hypothetical protein